MENVSERVRPSAEGIAYHRQQGSTYEEIGRQYEMQTADVYLTLRISQRDDPGKTPPFADCDKCAAFLGVTLNGAPLVALRQHLHQDHGIGS